MKGKIYALTKAFTQIQVNYGRKIRKTSSRVARRQKGTPGGGDAPHLCQGCGDDTTSRF